MVWGRWFRFILLQAEIHLSQHHILKSPFFSQWIVLASFLKKIDVKYELFSEISGIFHCSVCLSSQRCCLDYSLCSKSWSENYASWNSVLFQQRFGYSGSHVCPCEFWTCQLPEKKKKKPARILTRICQSAGGRRLHRVVFAFLHVECFCLYLELFSYFSNIRPFSVY